MIDIEYVYPNIKLWEIIGTKKRNEKENIKYYQIIM